MSKFIRIGRQLINLDKVVKFEEMANGKMVEIIYHNGGEILTKCLIITLDELEQLIKEAQNENN